MLVAALVVGPAGVAGARAVAPARTLPPRAARMIRLSPSGAVYQLPDGRRMALSRGGARSTARGSFSSILLWGVVRVHGRSFGVSIQASKDAGVGRDLMISFGTSRFKSPRRFALQDHSYDFGDLGGDWLQLPPDLSHGRISTGTLMGRWGDVELSFAADGPPTARCGGKNVFQKATVTGTFSFTPQEDNGFFGTISSMHVRKASLWVRRGCGGGGGGGGGRPQCPVQPFTADGMAQTPTTFVDFFGSQLRGRHRALIAVTYQQFIGDVSVLHAIDAISSPSAASLVGGEGARLKGFPNDYEHGSATLTTSGPPQLDGPYPCGRGHSVTYLTFYGTMSGTPGAPLTADFVTGAVSVPESPGGDGGSLGKQKIRG